MNAATGSGVIAATIGPESGLGGRILPECQRPAQSEGNSPCGRRSTSSNQSNEEVAVSARRMPMFKLRDVLRMHFEAQMSQRQIARALSLSRAGVQSTIGRAETAGLTWPLPTTMTDADLQSRLYPRSSIAVGRPRVALPDWQQVRSDLNNPNVTRRTLWEEYRASHPDGIGYSQYCDRYRRWLRHVDPVMRIERKAGGKTLCGLERRPARVH